METETVVKKKQKVKALVIGLVILVVIAAAFVLLLMLFNSEGQSASAEYMPEAASQAGYIEITAKSFSVDPVKGELSTRLQFTPNGTFATPDGSLAKDMNLYVNSANGKTTTTFKKGDVMSPMDVTIDIYGDVGFYPFDSHEGTLNIYLAAEKKDEAGLVTSSEMIDRPAGRRPW